jgi:uncharacterized membrane protein (UPF0182 family)
MEPTLDLALARLFGQSDRAPQTTASTAPAASASTTTITPSFDALATEAKQTYQRALDAQRAGDWAKYGEEIKRLGEVLDKMKAPH